jgi:hypothetical protein
MQNLMTRVSLFSMISLIVISLSGCGVSKIQECNSMGKVVKDNKTAVDKIETATESKNSDNIIQSLLSTSTEVDKLSKEMQGLEIKDEKLVNLQSQFANSKGLTDTAKGLQTKNKPMTNAAIAKMQEGDKKEVIMIKSFNTYCGWSGKESKAETAAPAQKK